MKLSKKKVIIILGPPGSGKGTQAQLLTERFGFFLWETSTIVGRVINQAKSGDFATIEGKKYFFRDQAELRRKGLLWDGKFTFYFSKKKLEELAKDGKSIVMSGSPRNLVEGKELLTLLKKLYGAKNIVMLALRVTPEVTIWRNSHRRECELATHSILYTKETRGLTKCPLDGSKLLRRKDDKPIAIKLRLKQYEEKTFPVFKYFREQSISVKEINGDRSVADVFKDILRKVK